MSIRRRFAVPAAVAILLAGTWMPAAGEGADTLTVERAVQLALDHHPSLRSAEANTRGAVAQHKGAVAGYLPAISFTASATHTEGVFVFNPSVPSRNQIYSSYTGGFQAQETIFDFGKTINRVSSTTDLEDAAAMDELTARELVIANVQIAYYSLLAARGVADVNDEAVNQAEKHLVQAKAFYSVGTRPRFDVTKAEVDLANAKVNQIIARNQTQVTQVQLENAMGFHPEAPYAQPPCGNDHGFRTNTRGAPTPRASRCPLPRGCSRCPGTRGVEPAPAGSLGSRNVELERV